jgi:soluble lytic murein transglycosylase-like protein
MRTRSAVCSAITLLVAGTPAVAAGQVAHTVEPGESLWSIAQQDGLTVEELAAANGLPPYAMLIAGDTLMIPPASPSASAVTGTGECVWDCASPAHPHPTDEVVTSEEVGSIASEYGMSAPLVQSIAWNESSFSNSVVSGAGARGVMQIIPDTWSFIEEQLAEQPLDPASAIDNVKAGVLYLHYLYHLKGGDGNATVSSYFQGPNREELLPETRTYVREIREDQAEFAGGG